MSTPAITALRRSGVPHTAHTYTTRPRDDTDRTYGEGVAADLGVEPDRVFKTLVVACDDTPHVAVVPVTTTLDLKAMAKAVGAKRAVMMDPPSAERLTGFVVGGIAPVGQKSTLPTIVDASAAEHSAIFVSAGRRGLQVEIAPEDLLTVTGGRLASLAR